MPIAYCIVVCSTYSYKLLFSSWFSGRFCLWQRSTSHHSVAVTSRSDGKKSGQVESDCPCHVEFGNDSVMCSCSEAAYACLFAGRCTCTDDGFVTSLRTPALVSTFCRQRQACCLSFPPFLLHQPRLSRSTSPARQPRSTSPAPPAPPTIPAYPALPAPPASPAPPN